MSAVHDIAYLTDLVEKLNKEMQNLKHVDQVEQVVRVPVQSGLQQSRNTSLETLTALVRKMDALEQYFLFPVSDEMSSLKRHLNSTTVQQLKAIDDIASLSVAIENLKNEVRSIQTSRCQFHQHFYVQIFRTNVRFGSFYYVHVTRKMTFVRKTRAFYVDEIDSRC